MSVIRYLSVLTISLVFFACSNQTEEKKIENKKRNDTLLLSVNKYLVKEDVERIKSYIKRREWKMDTTANGLWYRIYETKNSAKAKKGNIVFLKYKLELLDGTVCYTSDSLGLKKFKVGYGGVETGLDQGIMLMGEGDKANFILPPYMAHGLVGDDQNIPPRSVIVYNVELVKILEN